jgi:hypothetical protein
MTTHLGFTFIVVSMFWPYMIKMKLWYKYVIGFEKTKY